jgi:hypothetical protein
MANSTVVLPRLHEVKALGDGIAMAQPNRIQLVLLIEDMPHAPITVTPGNNGA